MSPGPINLQCRLKDGKAYVFEINCRFSTTNVVRAVCGYNEVHLLAENFLFGKKQKMREYRKVAAVAYMDYVYIDLDKFEDLKQHGYLKNGGKVYSWL